MPRSVRHSALLALALATSISGCKPQPVPKSAPAATSVAHGLAAQLAAARMDVAKNCDADEALGLLISALKADPTNNEARAATAKLLQETVWNLPIMQLDHQLAIDQITFATPSSLWVSLSGKFNTTVRWNLETLQIENVLFPNKTGKTRSLIFDSGHRSVVVQRGPVTLLCNAVTLKPIRDLGPLPEFFTPSAAITFSPEGLLVAHPARVSDQDPAIIWHLRDTSSGEIIRSSEPVANDAPRPMAAYLDRGGLRVLHADGSLVEMPLSPVEPIVTHTAKTPVKLLHALFSEDGNAALTLQDLGPHRPPAEAMIRFNSEEDQSLTPHSLAERFPWGQQPNIWSGLLHQGEKNRIQIDGRELRIRSSPHAPIRAGSGITTAAINGEKVMVGGENGTLVIYQLAPKPASTASATLTRPLEEKSLRALEKLTTAFSGLTFDEIARSFTAVGPDERLKALDGCDFEAIRAVFPALDFGPVIAAFKSGPPEPVKAEAFIPLWDRLAHADATGKSWPDTLTLSKNLSGHPWHQQLTSAVVSRKADQPVESTWTAPARIEKIFNTDDTVAILSAIETSGGKGPAAATALSLALASVHPEWVEACLKSAVDLPPFLRKLGRSRIAWLRNRKPEALAGWPEVFPTLAEIRLREDWEGWEQADFSPALEKLRLSASELLTALEVPEDSTPEQRAAIVERFKDPATIATIGRPRFADACLKAALAFSKFKEDREITFQLAQLARDLGAPQEPCLRAEALALTALSDYQEAHPRWIQLLTEHPVETHLSGDYAEAAYTAFENAEPRQAMEILTTGLHRFPADGNFAMRAGWVALLTGNPERAYQFLQTGQRIGFPDEKLDDAMALLAIAAVQNGAMDDAAVYYNDLLIIAPEWEDPATLESLAWPEELKASLREIAW
ncbi:MAG: tetratricopeptide repeat protein [Akkermansiaceae bacterium]